MQGHMMHCGHEDKLTASPPGPVLLPALPFNFRQLKEKKSVASCYLSLVELSSFVCIRQVKRQ
jgi:hypothetical protein